MKRVSGNTQKTALDRLQQRGKHGCDRTWRSALTKEMRPISGIGLIPAEDAGRANHRWGLGFLSNVYLKFSLGQDQVAKNKSFPASWVSHMRIRNPPNLAYEIPVGSLVWWDQGKI